MSCDIVVVRVVGVSMARDPKLRQTCTRVLLLAAIAWVSSIAAAQDFPTRPIRLVVPFPAGGPTDIVARPLAQFLGDALKQQVIVDNRGGAGGSIGAEMVAKSTADGYTLLMATVGTHAINASLYKKLAYDPVKDFTPIALVAAAPVALVAHPSLPGEFGRRADRRAKAQPGTIGFGTAGNGTPGHLTGEMFKTGVWRGLESRPVQGQRARDHRPDRRTDPGDVRSAAIGPAACAGRQAQAARREQRERGPPSAPDAPTFAEAGLKDFEATAWWGVFAPANLPMPIATQLNAEIDRIVRSEAFRERLVPRGVQVIGGSRESFAKFQQGELAKWGKAVRDSGAVVD